MRPKPAALLAALTLGLAGAGTGAQEMPFGSAEDVAYADLLWQVMAAQRLAGSGMIRAFPYEGTDPHGMLLETFYATGTVGGHSGDLIVKRNFGPEGVSVDEVLADPDGHLGAYTVMFRREAGYDPENLDWFWVRYNPDGSVSRTAEGVALAGRVARGMEEGCIACHQAAGGDMIFTSDHLVAN